MENYNPSNQNNQYNTYNQYDPQQEHEKMIELKRNIFFKKTANEATALVFLNLIIQNVISMPLFIAIAAIKLIPIIANGGDVTYGELMSVMTSGLWLWVVSIIATIIGTLVSCKIVGSKTGVTLGSLFKTKHKISSSLMATLTVLILGVNGLAMYLSMITTTIFNSVGLDSSSSITAPNDWVSFIAYALMVAVVAPIFEEIMFRGFMLNSLKRYGNFFAVFISSLFFGLMHGNLEQMPFALAVGFILGYATIKTGSIKTSIVLHAINNGVACLQGLLLMLNVPYVNEISFILFTVFAIAVIVFVVVAHKHISFDNHEDDESVVIPISHKYKKLFTAPMCILSLLACGYLMYASFVAI